MKRTLQVSALIALAGCACTATAQDSTSRNSDGGNGLPGDALRSLTNVPAVQRSAYVLDLAPITTQWGATFRVGPLTKLSKISEFPPRAFFTSLASGNKISQTILNGRPYASTSYALWNAPGQGVNLTENLTPGTITRSGEVSQFAASIGEFSTDDFSRVYDGVITTVVNFDASEPNRLYVTRVFTASSLSEFDAINPLTAGNHSSLGNGSVDAEGNSYFRADNFGITGAFGIFGNCLYRTDTLARNPAVINVITNDASVGFGKDATTRLLTDSATTHACPINLPVSMTGAPFPMIVVPNFATEYGWGNALVPNPAPAMPVVGTTHRPGTGDHRGNLVNTARSIVGGAPAGTLPGTMAVLSRASSARNNAISLFRVNATGAVTRAVTLRPPSFTAAAPNDVCIVDGFSGELGGYRSGTSFRGHTPIALGQDAAGRGLVAGVLLRAPTTAGDTPGNETRNAIIVGRFDPNNPLLGTDPAAVQWSVVGQVDLVSGVWSGTNLLKDTNGDKIGDTVVGNLINRGAINTPPTIGTTDRVSLSSPAFDSRGNVYFTATVMIDEGGTMVPRVAVIRAVYDGSDPLKPRYTLDPMFTNRTIVAGQNSGTNYQIRFISLDDAASVGVAAIGGASTLQAAWNNTDPTTYAQVDSRTLGGLVVSCGIRYDVSGDGVFEDPSASGTGGGTSTDEAYNVLLYVGADVPTGTSPACCVDFNGDTEVDFSDVEGFLAALGAMIPGSCAPGADFNGDTEFDFSDIEAFIAIFNAALGTTCEP